MRAFDDDLVIARQQRFREALEESDLDAFVGVSEANVTQLTGYQSVSAILFSGHPMRAVMTRDRVILVAPSADSGPALEIGIDADDFVPYGRFYFMSPDGHPASEMADRFPDSSAALAEACLMAGIDGGRVGIDASLDDRSIVGAISEVAPSAELVEASSWALGVRGPKLPAELARLSEAAALAFAGIDAAINAAGPGITERELAAIVASTMAQGGGMPRFVVASIGVGSALADVHPTDREWRPGELLRFDVGCTFDGYWSDVGRTAVLGEPDDLQINRYDAIYAGVEAELEAIRPGASASVIFDLAVEAVRRNGIDPYPRQHCGHGIGADVYEPPIIRPDEEGVMKEGMTFCLETPFYELGWAGMMVEDTVVVTEDGVEFIAELDRSLRVVPE
jgi:Xaa-Pro aminopeptidase